jgi:NAD(P)H-quinone oxidoreductase subunit 5
MGIAAFVVAIDRSPDRALAMGTIAGWLVFGAALLVSALGAMGAGAADPVTAITMLLTTFVGAIVLSFSQRYLRADRHRRAYVVKVLLLLAALLVFGAARSTAALAAGWIGSGWLLAALIGHAGEWDEARRARRRALVCFAIGDAALVGALALLLNDSGSLALPATTITPGAKTLITAVLVVIAAAVRSASPPFHRWLGRSMTAPTPVSALMHAGFVNGGGILLIRMAPLIEAAPAARMLAIAIGTAAALIGSAIMLVRADVKRSLAGSTTAQMGFMLVTCGLGAYAAAMWHLVAHGLFKAWLFLRSGSAIGRSPRPADIGPAPGVIALLGAGAVVALIAIDTSYPLPPAAVPITLAVVTALSAAPRLSRDGVLAGVSLAIAAAYAAGLWLFDRVLVEPSGPAIGGPIMTPLLVGIFMTAWCLQALVIRGRLRLPTPLYTRLLAA